MFHIYFIEAFEKYLKVVIHIIKVFLYVSCCTFETPFKNTKEVNDCPPPKVFPPNKYIFLQQVETIKTSLKGISLRNEASENDVDPYLKIYPPHGDNLMQEDDIIDTFRNDTSPSIHYWKYASIYPDQCSG